MRIITFYGKDEQNETDLTKLYRKIPKTINSDQSLSTRPQSLQKCYLKVSRNG